MHFFFLESGIDTRFYVEFDLTRPLLHSTSANIDFDWDTHEVRPRDNFHTFSIHSVLPADYFSSHFVGRIQFPCADDFIISVDSDPEASLLLKIDGSVIFTTVATPFETLLSNQETRIRPGLSVSLSPGLWGVPCL